jgi:hypothetical protein
VQCVHESFAKQDRKLIGCLLQHDRWPLPIFLNEAQSQHNSFWLLRHVENGCGSQEPCAHAHAHAHAINGFGRVNDFGKARATSRAGSEGLGPIFQISMLGQH